MHKLHMHSTVSEFEFFPFLIQRLCHLKLENVKFVLQSCFPSIEAETEMTSPAPTSKMGEKEIRVGGKRIKIIPVENQRIVGEIKKQLSTHLTFEKQDKVELAKTLNRNIVSKDLTLKKVPRILKSQVIRPASKVEDPWSLRREKKTIASRRMEKFLAMKAADCNTAKKAAKPPACLDPILKPVKDSLRCIKCQILYDPTKHSEHQKICVGKKVVLASFGCLLCNFKSTNQDDISLHVKEIHK